MALRFATFLALLVLAGYGILKAIPLIEGPEIRLSSPAHGQTFGDGFVKVAGVSLHTQSLTLDGAPLLIDENGAFATTLVLPHGGAILSLTATDRFGKTERLERSIYVP